MKKTRLKKLNEQQEKEIKRIEEENLVSIDNVIFEPMPKRKTKPAKTHFDETMGVEYFEKRPYPRDKYIYENTTPEEDTIYLDKLGRKIEIACFILLGVSLLGLLFVLYWVR